MIPQFSKDFYEICCVLFYPLCFCFIIFHFNLIRNGRFSIHDFPCQTAIDRAKNLENSADEVKEERSTKDPSPDSKSLESVSSQISQLALSTIADDGRSLTSAEGSDTSATAGVDIEKKIRAVKKKVRLPLGTLCVNLK